jgi:hypothetical protein
LAKIIDGSAIGNARIEKGNCGVIINHNLIGEDLVSTFLNTSAESVRIGIPRESGKHFFKINLEIGQILNIDSGSAKDPVFYFAIHPREFIIILKTQISGSKQLENIPFQKMDSVVPEYRSYIGKERGLFELKSLNRFPLSRWKTMVSVNREKNIIHHNYETSFEAVELPETAILVFYDKIPDPNKKIDRFELKLNGVGITPLNPDNYPEYNEDRRLLAFDISSAVSKDRLNMLSIRKTNDDDLPDPVAYPPFILVSAAVEKGQNSWKILDAAAGTKNCSWDTKGYQFLIGQATSLYHFEVPKNYSQVVLAFDDLSGATHIALNEKKQNEEEDEAMIDYVVRQPLHVDLIFPPYRVNVTEFVTDKRNNLLITSSSTLNPQNQLAPSVGGVLGNARLEIITKE